MLTGGSVVTVDDERRVLDPGAVAIAGDRIVAVGSPDELVHWRATRTIDCRGKAVLPGLVDCHTHLFQALVRGLGEGIGTWRWLCGVMFPYAIAIDGHDARVAAALGAVEAVRAGTTCVVDHHYAPSDLATTLAVADAIDGVGIRGAVARGMRGERTAVATRRSTPVGVFHYGLDEELAITEACIDARPPGARVVVWPAPVSVINGAHALTRSSIELARARGTRWHTHCSEARDDPELFLEAYGLRPIEWLDSEGLLGPEITLAHGIWLDDGEIERVGERNAGVAYNPVSNQHFASGTLRLRELRTAGTTIGLGTDGPGGSHRQDLFECMHHSILAQRAATLDPEASNAEEALELATREGARLVGIDAGVLSPGKLADVIVVALDRPHLRPLHKVVSTLVYSARGADVEVTIVGGRIAYEGGRCTLVDEQAIVDEAQGRAEKLVARAGMGELLVPWRRQTASGRPRRDQSASDPS